MQRSSCPNSPQDCPMLIVTGPSTLVRPSSLNSRRSNGEPATEDNQLLRSPEMTSCGGADDIGSALSDSELDRVSVRSTGSHSRTLRSRRRAINEPLYRDSNSSTDSENCSPSLSIVSHQTLRVISSTPSSKWFRASQRKSNASTPKRPTRRVSCKDLGGGQCKGWLMKKKEGVGLTAKTWSKRWFVLSHKSLYYYKTEQDEKAEGVIYLPGFQISPAPEIKTKKFAFKAHHTGTTFYFAAERQDDMAKWMNKLGLASLSDLVLGDFVQTAGFWKPDQLRPVKSASNLEVSHMDSKISNFCYSESEESLTSLSERPSPAASVSNSREDLSDLLRNIRRADLDIAGANVRDRRSTVLLGLRSEVDSEYDVCWRRLLSLNRTIKDKEQTLSAVEEFLSSEPITSERLKRFIQQHPHIASPQQPTESVYDDSRSTDSTDLVDGGVPASDSNSTLDNDDEPADNCV